MASAIVYNPGSGDVTLTFKRGPLDFRAGWEGVVHDNPPSSGAEFERVTENRTLMISFQMPHMVVADDLESWESLMSFALTGAAFKFYPTASIDYWFNCQLVDQGWSPARTARKKYGAPVKLRVVEDAHTPTGPVAILRRFYGLSS